jgi:hypothetical protein
MEKNKFEVAGWLTGYLIFTHTAYCSQKTAGHKSSIRLLLSGQVFILDNKGLLSQVQVMLIRQ